MLWAWSEFVPLAVRAGAIRSSRAPTTDNWIERREGPVAWLFTIREHETQMTLYGDGYSSAGNNAYVETLLQRRAEIENALGRPVEAEASPNKKHSKIWVTSTDGGYKDEPRWPATFAAMLRNYSSLHKACEPYMRDAASVASSVSLTAPVLGES